MPTISCPRVVQPFPITVVSTCWPLLVLLLPLFPLVQLLESLSCLLEPGHKPFDVIQGRVEDLLRLEEELGVSHCHPHLWGHFGNRMSQAQCQQEAGKDGKESWKAVHPPFPFLFSEPALPVAPHPGIPCGDNLFKWWGEQLLKGSPLTARGVPTYLAPQPTWFTEWHWQRQAHTILGLRGISSLSLEGNGGWALWRGQDRLPLPDLLLVSPRGEKKTQFSLAEVLLLGAATLLPSLPPLLCPKQKGKIPHFLHPRAVL